MKSIAPLALAALCASCGSAKSEEPQNPNPIAQQHHGNTSETMEGGADYVAQCARCHGPTGKGSDTVPAVVGSDALPLDPGAKSKIRHAKFVTAKDVFDFMRTYMPKDKPGTLSDDQYYAILAFDLKLNGVDLHGTKIDPTTVGLIRLPNR